MKNEIVQTIKKYEVPIKVGEETAEYYILEQTYIVDIKDDTKRVLAKEEGLPMTGVTKEQLLENANKNLEKMKTEVHPAEVAKAEAEIAELEKL